MPPVKVLLVGGPLNDRFIDVDLDAEEYTGSPQDFGLRRAKPARYLKVDAFDHGGRSIFVWEKYPGARRAAADRHTRLQALDGEQPIP
jgi:hypothetical protein